MMATQKYSKFTTRSVAEGEFNMGVRSSNAVGKTVILVHGLGSSEKYFRRLAGILSQKYFVVSLTLPGHGETNKLPRALDLNELTHVTAQFIRRDNIVNPIVVGHSMGSQITARLAPIADLSIEKVILLSPVVDAKERAALLQFFRLLQDIFREPLESNVLQLSGYVKLGFRRFIQTQRSMLKDKIEISLREVAQPTLIIRGEKDKIVSQKWTRLLLAKLANGSFMEIKGGLHNVHYTHSRDVARACIDFIEKN